MKQKHDDFAADEAPAEADYDETAIRRLPAQEVLDADHLNQAKPARVELLKLQEIIRLVQFDTGEGVDEMQARITRAIDLYRGLKPIDAAEGMLGLQMVATHMTAMECMYRAVEAEATDAQRTEALNMARKLMDLHLRLSQGFDRHRRAKLQELQDLDWAGALYRDELMAAAEADRAGDAKADPADAAPDDDADPAPDEEGASLL